MQLRGAIEKRSRARVPQTSSPQPVHNSSDGLQRSSLDRLEDSLIGNDVLLEESRHHSNALVDTVRSCLGHDRFARSAYPKNLVTVPD